MSAPRHAMPTPQQLAAYNSALDFAERQVKSLVQRDPNFFPMYTVGGKWRHGGEKWTHWTDGFLGGMMWQFYLRERLSTPAARSSRGDRSYWREEAERYSRLLEYRQHDRDVHDLGFIFLSTYLPWYELTGDKQLYAVLIQAGRTLAMRFKERGQYL